MESLTATLCLKALDGLSMRSIATSQNIANASTPSYRPVRVKFEEALAEAARRGEAAVREVYPRLERADAHRESGTRLDLELSTASATALRYSAVIEVLNRQLQIEAQAVTGSV